MKPPGTLRVPGGFAMHAVRPGGVRPAEPGAGGPSELA